MRDFKVAQLMFPDITVGEIYQVERTFTTQDVRAFAELSGDFSPLHVDPTYAQSTEFGACVVHGLLLASLFSHLVGMRIPGKHALYLGQDLAFRKPVLVGETITASARVVGKNEATHTLSLETDIRTADGRIAVSGSAKVKVRDSTPLQAGQSIESVTSSPAHGRRVALVTGASRGIGAAIAATLARRDVAVAVNYFRSPDSADRLVRGIRKDGGIAIALYADVREADDVRSLIDGIVRQFGRLDQVVNGVAGELGQERFVDLGWSAFQYQIDYHLKPAVMVCQAAYPFLKGAARGSIVNVLSQVIRGAPPARMSDYVAAKYALWGLSKALAAEWAPDGIRVNTVSPGLVQTGLTQHYPDRVFKSEAARTPLRRLARPTDVANAVAYLLSDEAEFLTGVNVSVTGGQVMD